MVKAPSLGSTPLAVAQFEIQKSSALLKTCKASGFGNDVSRSQAASWDKDFAR
jgi:hypothetical protein